MLSSKEQIGKLDRRVTFRSPVYAKDGYNQDKIVSWDDVATVWASLEDSSGSEVNQADQITAVRTTTFRIRYRDDLSETFQVRFDGRYYDIESIQRPDRNRFLIVKTSLLDDPVDEEEDEDEGAFSDTEFSPAFA